MKGKSYWIWHYGDYEIFHVMPVHLRREERGYHRPPAWKISLPYPSVDFRKTFSCDEGCLVCHLNGNGYLTVDGKRYSENTRVELAAGSHAVEVQAPKR